MRLLIRCGIGVLFGLVWRWKGLDGLKVEGFGEVVDVCGYESSR